MKDIFSKEVTEEIIGRIENLNESTQPQWGKMAVGQMLAHCSVPYDFVYTDNYPKPNFLLRFILKTFIKKGVVNEAPYPKNSRTAPEFLITDKRDFENEKSKLITSIRKTQELGKDYFNNKESRSFGTLSGQEWNNMFYKHLDHHLNQFGV